MASWWEDPLRPRIVVLIGSARFYREFQEANFRESIAGNIVLSLAFHTRDDVPHSGTAGITAEEKERLDAVYLKKIEMADEVLLIAPGSYIGDSTTRELFYAKQLGKLVRVYAP